MLHKNQVLKAVLTVVLPMCLQAVLSAQVKVGETYPDWSAGYMDIHHINTGRGECVFAILPDGTTMMIDAGETGPSPRTTDARPDDSRSTGEWFTRYIRQMMRPLREKKLDYIFLTHLHGDHMGSMQLSRQKSAKGDYMLTGITEVGDNIPFGKIVDRGWPDYNWPVDMSGNRLVQNYIRFIEWHTAHGAKAEQFKPGSNRQFTLLRQADKYPEFEIRNIAANGVVWTGIHDNVRNHFPPLDAIPKEAYPGENTCSAAIRISYGRFDYFNGGDISHNHAPAGAWQDIETPVGLATGPVDVCEVNHHAYADAMGEAFIKAVRPRVFIIQVWDAGHPVVTTYSRMLSQSVYPGDRDIFATNLLEAVSLVIGEQQNKRMKSTQGHIVIRVHPGGDHYDICILDDTAENFTVKAIHGPYESR
jgi:beta-lactamase superfamily II metal-dependent hydrolase